MELYHNLTRKDECNGVELIVVDYVKARFQVWEMIKNFIIVKPSDLKSNNMSSDGKSEKEAKEKVASTYIVLRSRLHLAMALIERKAGNFSECFKQLELAKGHCKDKVNLIRILETRAWTNRLDLCCTLR